MDAVCLALVFLLSGLSVGYLGLCSQLGEKKK